MEFRYRRRSASGFGPVHSSETAAEVRLLICSLDGDRNHSAGLPAVVRCLRSANDPNPTDIIAHRVSGGHLLKLDRARPVETLELAWIVRKKPIWSPS